MDKVFTGGRRGESIVREGGSAGGGERVTGGEKSSV